MAKSKYETHVADKLFLVECWARDGLSDEQLAEKIGISIASFYNYKKKHLEFLEAIKKGKEIVDYEVENALLKRAKGYDYEEEKIEVCKDNTGDITSTKVTQIIKHVPPDVGAIAIWLKNRRPDKWRDRQSVEVTGTINNPLQDISADDLKKLIDDD